MLNPEITTAFHVATAFAGTAPPLRRDPLTLDLDNDGLETIGIDASNPILFDHSGDGIRTATGWVKPDDGFLVLDRNANGSVDNGSELFGDSTPLSAGGKARDGFDALAQEDTNADGRVDGGDARFSQLRLWRDLNQDGVSQGGELFTLGQAGVAALLVAKTEHAVVLDNGNQIADLGGFIRSDGTGGTLGAAEQLADIDLASDPFYRQFIDHIALTDAARTLPDMQGSGMVRNLREAASLTSPQGAELASRLAQYSAAATRPEQLALLDGLVQAWAATSTLGDRGDAQLYRSELSWVPVWVLPGYWMWGLTTTNTALDPDFNREVLATLKVTEAFNGSTLPGNAFFDEQFSLLDQGRAAINASVYRGLVLQTRLKPYLDVINLSIDESGVSLDCAGMMALLEARKSGDVQNAVFDLLDLSKYAGSLLSGWDWAAELETWSGDATSAGAVMAALVAMGFATPSGSWGGGTGVDSVFGSSAADYFSGNSGDDLLMGRGGNDTLVGNGGSDTLLGGSGDDILMAGSNTFVSPVMTDPNESAANTLQGGLGADRLYGSSGAETYLFNPGDGSETIYEVANGNASAAATATDRIVLGRGIAPADVTVTRNSTDLILKLAAAGDQIIVAGWYDAPGRRIEQLVFADGSVWDGTRLHAAGLVVQGTADADMLIGLNGEADVLYGNAGNDALIGNTGNDTLVGGAGDDTLRAAFDRMFTGAEIGERESDANTLEGGPGNDRLYGGGGSDTYSYAPGDGADTIYETSYASPDGTIRSDTASDRIVLGAGIAPSNVMVTRNGADLILVFANAGDQITLSGWYNAAGSRIEQLVFADATVWDRATLHADGLVMQGTAGPDTYYGLVNEADALYGNGGDDTLIGDTGNDTLVGGAGDDTLRAAFGLAFNGSDSSYRESDANTLEGGTGNDRLYGGGGSDSYRYGTGDGTDTIYETSYASADGTIRSDTASDRIVLAAGIAPTEVTATRNGADLILRFANAGDQITVSGWYNAAGSRIEQLLFADATVWDRATLHAAGLVVQGTAGPDTLFGLVNEADALYGNAGDDTLIGDTGNDTLVGGAGDDTLRAAFGLAFNGSDSSYRESDANTLEGGTGNDRLYGGGGSDSYHYDPGDGADSIYETWYIGPDGYSITDTATDRIVLGAGIAPTDVTATRSGADLVLTFADGGDQITVSGWYNSTGSRIEQLAFADGTLWSPAQIEQARATPRTNAVPVLAMPIDDRNVAEDFAFAFALPANTFTDADARDHLRYAATLADATSLPAWLSFDAATQSFSGMPTSTSAGQWTLRVTATDDAGASASGTFVVDVANHVQGSANDDALTGTTVRDVVDGLAGNDSLSGFGGNDTLLGGLGDDIFTVDDVGTVVTEYAGEGTDSVQSSLNYTLGANLENLILTGSAPLQATGNALNNLLGGNAAANQLIGAGGDDTLDGGAGKDTLSGGPGDDTYLVDNAGDVVSEAVGEGIDLVLAAVSHQLSDNVDNLMLTGTRAINATGNARSNTLTGNAAANRLDGGGGADTLIGNAGNDVYVVDDLGDVVVENANEGSDTVQSFLSYVLGANLEHLTLAGSAAVDGGGNELNNHLSGNAANNVLNAGPGNDLLKGGAGNDTLVGGSGNDTYVVEDAGDVLIEGAAEGTDTVQASLDYTLGANLENLTLTGTASLNGRGNELNNRLSGNAADNRLDGGLGNDTLNGGAGADTLLGGPGDDSYSVDNGAEVVVEFAGEGNDTVNSAVSFTLPAHVERLTLSGSANIDGTGNELGNPLVGNGASNILFGAAGDDTLNGGGASDTLLGGPGNDTYTIDAAGDVVIEAANEGTDTVNAAVDYRLADHVDNLTLTGATAVEGTGNALDNLLTGNKLANLLSGGTGNDTLDGKAGGDTLSGGPGDDIYYLDNAGDLIVETAGEGQDVAYSSVSRALDANLEHLILLGSAGLGATGNGAGNLLRGNPGNNILDGKAGVDILEGQAGNDTLTDTADNNCFIGGSGNDRLTAGPGNDLLIGGVGKDSINAGDGNDVIAFNRGDGYDTIYLASGARETVSLGGGIVYADLSLRKSGNDLVLDTGHGEGMVFKNWYVGSANKNVFNLQVVADAASGFDFRGLVGAFDLARLATPTLTSWLLTKGLDQYSVSSSDSAAFGGDLAYQYGRNGTLAGFGSASAQQILGDAQFGVQAQGLHPSSGLLEGMLLLG